MQQLTALHDPPPSSFHTRRPPNSSSCSSSSLPLTPAAVTMLSFNTATTSLTVLSSQFKNPTATSVSVACRASAVPASNGVGTPGVAAAPQHLRCESKDAPSSSVSSEKASWGLGADKGAKNGYEEEEEKRIPGIQVPRQKYISVPKAELLDAILSTFPTEQEAEDFKRFASYLDSILHAEHKVILEEMRSYYGITSKEEDTCNDCSSIEEKEISSKKQFTPEIFDGTGSRGKYYDRVDEVISLLQLPNGLNLKSIFGQTSEISSMDSVLDARVAFATQFQRSFMKLLRDAQFEELSAQDLAMTNALNSDYLLTLPIYIDWKRASESNAIIFRRGYATERQKGLLIVEKLEYLQSKLLQRVFFSLSRPLKKVGAWFDEVLRSSSEAQDIQKRVEKVKIWLKEQYFPPSMKLSSENISRDLFESDQLSGDDLPIWLVAQKAVSRYEGVLSSTGPRGRLIKRILSWTGLIPSVPETSIALDKDNKYLENYLRPSFLPRITLRNIWEPATGESCDYNIWKMIKTAAYILFSQSTLQEPAFQELILLYTGKASQRSKGAADILPLQLKIYEKIPIPDLPVIFPDKKLSFRILDTVRLDAASILGLLAYFINYKFENILSSPSAILLDAIAASALVLYVTRVVLGYKQTRDRYQLLVNRTLYEKTLASGFGSVHFLLDASEQQQFKEAILVYAISLHPDLCEAFCRKGIKDACERFVYDTFKEKIEMPIDKAVETLVRLDLLSEIPINGHHILTVLPCRMACEALKERWNALLEQRT